MASFPFNSLSKEEVVSSSDDIYSSQSEKIDRFEAFYSPFPCSLEEISYKEGDACHLLSSFFSTVEEIGGNPLSSPPQYGDLFQKSVEEAVKRKPLKNSSFSEALDFDRCCGRPGRGRSLFSIGEFEDCYLFRSFRRERLSKVWCKEYRLFGVLLCRRTLLKSAGDEL